MLEKLKWYLKQLLPMKYKSQFKVAKESADFPVLADVDGKLTCEWRQWFGIPFDKNYTSGWA